MNNEMHICHFIKCIVHCPNYMNDLLVLNSDINGRNIGFIPFFGQKKFKVFSRTHFPFFQGLHSVQKRALSLSFLVVSKHEQFYPEGLPVFAPFRHLRMVRANPGNSQNSSLNLVCPRFKRETEGARTFSVWAAGLWKNNTNFF